MEGAMAWNNRIGNDQQRAGQIGKMGGMGIYGMVGNIEANGVCYGDIWVTSGKH